MGFLELLRDGPVIFDGGMGSALRARLPRAPRDLAHLVLSLPDEVQAVHAEFLEAGVDVIQTHSFTANRGLLAAEDLAPETYEINREAARLARQVADGFSTPRRRRLVAGSIGPAGAAASGENVWADQIRGLVDGEVDLLSVETMTSLAELKAALLAIAEGFAGGLRRLPVLAQVTVGCEGLHLPSGDALAGALGLAEGLHAQAFGINCAFGPGPLDPAARWLGRHARLSAAARPSAGLPATDPKGRPLLRPSACGARSAPIGLATGKPSRGEAAEARYPIDPDEFAGHLRRYVTEMGMAIVGGCCGAAPAHLRAAVEALRGAEVRVFDPPAPIALCGRGGALALPSPAASRVDPALDARQDSVMQALVRAGDDPGILARARAAVGQGAEVLHLALDLSQAAPEGEAEILSRLLPALGRNTPALLLVEADTIAGALAATRAYPGRLAIYGPDLSRNEEAFQALIPAALLTGSALAVRAIDARGPALSADRKLELACLLHDRYTCEHALPEDRLLIDPLLFPLIGADPRQHDSPSAFLEATRQIHAALPGVTILARLDRLAQGLDGPTTAALLDVFGPLAEEAGARLICAPTPEAEPTSENRALILAALFAPPAEATTARARLRRSRADS